ncbi:hypothetical protein PN36_31035 [Candidatus Thiomargarita nelsonii]|uniref:Phage-associated protein, BcepMu gp16 family n=1 Tax=Candidatus Thiomargarita nelsonii TaxID=1003181 RepID=A0A4E0RDH1_9GAMM|nr:hypothetical protein PN36_31035 [Candidatus Thiomargarita nelsonii]
MAAKSTELIGNRQLLNEVIGRFRMRGMTLMDWCRENGLMHQNARVYLLGERNGKVAREWRRRIVDAARQTRRNKT